MDPIDESKSFLKHVFNFEKDSKIEISNILQYTLLAIVPIVALNRAMQKYVPKVDETKPTIEILAEILGQVGGIVLGLLCIHRIITYIPTYSAEPYPEYNVIFSVLSILLTTLSLQTKLGEKVKIVTDRAFELWNGPATEGTTSQASLTKNNNGIVVRQPISGQRAMPTQHPVYTDGTSVMDLPQNGGGQDMAAQPDFYNQSAQPPTQQPQQNTQLQSASELGSFSGFSSW